MKRFYVVLCASLVCAMNVMAQAYSESKNVDCNGSVTIKATPAENYHFVKWVDGATGTEYTTASLTISNIKEAKNYTAHFAADETTIDPSIDPGVDFPVTHGTTLHLTPHTDDDCLEFDHWSDIADSADPLYNVVPRDFEYNGVLPTFTAIFRTKTYQVNVGTATGNATQGTVEIIVP